MISIKEKTGIRIASPVTNLAAAGVANAAAVFTLPILAGVLVGTKSAIIKKISIYNNAAGNTQVLIGTGAAAAFVALLPALDTFNGLNDTYVEDELPEVEAYANITAYPVALVAGTSIDIVIEALVRG